MSVPTREPPDVISNMKMFVIDSLRMSVLTTNAVLSSIQISRVAFELSPLSNRRKGNGVGTGKEVSLELVAVGMADHVTTQTKISRLSQA